MKRYNFSHPIESYSYSSPRVGNEEFAKYVAASNIPAIRYTNNDDVVPHLPPRSLDYVHAGLEYHFAEGTTKQCSQDYDEDPDCAIKYNSPLSFRMHYFPDGKLLPFPPYC
ncbi:hypothetical protein DSO57_1004554 [Entomophthora muscae]|uniref:Uncharacterized protein n=1 Tax=Entomophthora muscae TaxID=34485 RepID=A0ACC2SA21_9FUNG|nr:hypothetical protein DSO57_1004554 [Entomophthora muscae]